MLSGGGDTTLVYEPSAALPDPKAMEEGAEEGGEDAADQEEEP
jgi:hypothetical protein